MSDWVDLFKIFPGTASSRVHVIETGIEPLLQKLAELDFVVFHIDGTKILDEVTFFNEVARALDFPSYFGKNWDAWDDSIGDFAKFASIRTAIVWENVSLIFANDAQDFIDAVLNLNDIARNAKQGHFSENNEQKQIEIFIVK